MLNHAGTERSTAAETMLGMAQLISGYAVTAGAQNPTLALTVAGRLCIGHTTIAIRKSELLTWSELAESLPTALIQLFTRLAACPAIRRLTLGA